MPFNSTQLETGANYQLDYYLKNDPIDQVNHALPLYSALMQRKKDTVGGNQYEVEQIRIGNSSSYQNYFGDEQVTYGKKDTVRQAKFPWANFHDGFGVDEDTLAANGITLTDNNADAVPSADEKVRLTDLMKENFETLKLGIQNAFARELYQDGTQDADAVAGLAAMISLTPNTGTYGGINAATAAYWRNHASTNIATGTVGTLTKEMEAIWRACGLRGGQYPTHIFCGSKFFDAYKADANAINARQIVVPQRGGITQDASTTGLYFNGIEVVWDPTLDLLDEEAGTSGGERAKRAYFLNLNTIKLKPLKGHWMVRRKPPRVYDRYVHYWAMTSKYRFTCNKRNANAVLSIA